MEQQKDVESVGDAAQGAEMPVAAMPPCYMVFDVESVGLHGEGFAFGFVVVDAQGYELHAFEASCDPADAQGAEEDRAWVAANVTPPPRGYVYAKPSDVRYAFWKAWSYWRKLGAVLVAECAWPVEARFLLECLKHPFIDHRKAPYPLHDVASVMLAAGIDPMRSYARRPSEVPAHNPLCDARQSARLLIEALGIIREGRSLQELRDAALGIVPSHVVIRMPVSGER